MTSNLGHFNLKGTVSAISSDLPFIDRHVRSTTVPFKPCFDQGFQKIFLFIYIAGNKMPRNRASVH